MAQWCEDVNRVYVGEESFEKYKPTSFWQLLEGFKEYKGEI
jgi:type III restriction enzyme